MVPVVAPKAWFGKVRQDHGGLHKGAFSAGSRGLARSYGGAGLGGADMGRWEEGLSIDEPSILYARRKLS